MGYGIVLLQQAEIISQNNMISGNRQGGIWMGDQAAATMQDTTSSSNFGYGISAYGAVILTIRNSTLPAGFGGGK